MRTYELTASPLIYPGQVLCAAVCLDTGSVGDVLVRLLIRRYGPDDDLIEVPGNGKKLAPGGAAELAWTIPEFGGQPIAEIGISITSVSGSATGQVLIDWISWDGEPCFSLRCPDEPGSFWRRAWVRTADTFEGAQKGGLRISKGRGEGLVLHGTRQWADYRVSASLNIHLGSSGGLIARARGLRRFYCARVRRGNLFEIVRVYDREREVLASARLDWNQDETIPVSISAAGDAVRASAAGVLLETHDTAHDLLSSGGIGMLIADGAMTAEDMRVSPA